MGTRAIRLEIIAGRRIRPRVIKGSMMIGAIEEIRSEGTDSIKSRMEEFAGDLLTSKMRRRRTEVRLFLNFELLPTSWATGHRGWPRSLWSRGLKRDGAMGWP
jgi:hypothetical protein